MAITGTTSASGAIALAKLLAMVNTDNPAAAITVDNVIIGSASDNSNVAVNRDTMVTFTAVGGVKARGSCVVYYNRIDLSILFKNIAPSVRFSPLEGNIYYGTDLLSALNIKYGTDFEEADFIKEEVALGTLPTTITLTPNSDNLAYTGSFSLIVSNEVPELSEIIVTTTLNGFNYPYADETKGQAAIYSYNFDGSDDAENYWGTAVITDATDLSTISTAFTLAFNRLEGLDEDWVYSASPANYNLGGATVRYNGANSAADISVALGETLLLNPLYQKVLILRLSTTLCSNFGGNLTVYYGGNKA